MAEYQRVVIVGVGLLGGSIAMALRQRGLAQQVIGVGRREAALRQAVALGAIDDWEADLPTACRGAELVVICTPVQMIVEHVQACRGELQATALITDVGSTKLGICEALRDDSTPGQAAAAAQFCGSHPLAGSDKSGVEHATADLLVDKLTIVTPTSQTSEAVVARTENFWRSLGSRTRRMDPAEHDQALAQISHLPHVLASALAAATPAELLPLAASGWRDTTRVAAGNVELWRQILCENRRPVLDALISFTDELQAWLAALKDSDPQQLESLLERGKQHRDRVGN